MTPACMGGMCPKREQCARYHAIDRREPAERLCEPGKANMFLALKPVRVVKAPGPLEHIPSPDCWCSPEVDYVDPDTGGAVYVHRDVQ